MSQLADQDIEEKENTIYYCHSCEKNVNQVEELNDGSLKCKICNEEYIEIVESDDDDDDNDDNIDNNDNNDDEKEQKQNPQNNNNNNPHNIPHYNNNNNQNNVNRFQNFNNLFRLFSANNINNNSNRIINNNNIFFMNNININNINRNRNLNLGDFAFDHQMQSIISNLGVNNNNGGPPPANKDVVDKLEEETFNINDIDKMNKNDDLSLQCPICKDLFQNNELIKKMPCNHKYHKDCLLSWLKLRNNCPVCRFKLKTDDPHYEQMQQQQNNQNNDNSNNNNQPTT